MQLHHAPPPRKPTRDKQLAQLSAELSGATRNSGERRSWRDWLRVHPAADLFPLMGKQELRALAEDIKQYGLREPVSFIKDENRFVLLEGRNRLDALELLGKEITHDTLNDSAIFEQLSASIDATAFIVSKNIHRRHLTDQKRQLIARLLKATPEKSNRQIAEQVKASHHTVEAVRAEMVSTGQVARLETTTGKDGKSRKRPIAKNKALDKAVAVLVTADTICKTNPKVKTKASQRRAARWVEKANAAVEALTELEELRWDIIEAQIINIEDALNIAKRAAELGPLLVAESCTASSAAATIIEAPAEQPNDNDLDIPNFLLRKPKEEAAP